MIPFIYLFIFFFAIFFILKKNKHIFSLRNRKAKRFHSIISFKILNDVATYTSLYL
jgi:hypothetical protein